MARRFDSCRQHDGIPSNLRRWLMPFIWALGGAAMVLAIQRTWRRVVVYILSRGDE